MYFLKFLMKTATFFVILYENMGVGCFLHLELGIISRDFNFLDFYDRHHDNISAQDYQKLNLSEKDWHLSFPFIWIKRCAKLVTQYCFVLIPGKPYHSLVQNRP